MKNFFKESWFKITILFLIIISMYLHFSREVLISDEVVQVTNTLSNATTTTTATSSSTQVTTIEKKSQISEPVYKESVKSEIKNIEVVVTKPVVQPVTQTVTPQMYVSNVLNSLLNYQKYSEVIIEEIGYTEETYKPLFDLDYPYGSRFKTAIDDLKSIRSDMYKVANNIGSDVNNFRVWNNRFQNGQDIDQVNTVQKMATDSYNSYSKEMERLVLFHSETMSRINKNREEASKYLDEKIKERAKRALSCTYSEIGWGITKVYCE